MLTPEQVQRIRAWTDVPDETVAALCDTVDELRGLLTFTWRWATSVGNSVLGQDKIAAIRAAIGDGDDMKTNHAQPAM